MFCRDVFIQNGLLRLTGTVWKSSSNLPSWHFNSDTHCGKLGHKCINTCNWEENPLRDGDQKRVIPRFMIQIGSLFISIKVWRCCYNEKLKCTLQNTWELTPWQTQSLPDLQNEGDLWCLLQSLKSLRQIGFGQNFDRRKTSWNRCQTQCVHYCLPGKTSCFFSPAIPDLHESSPAAWSSVNTLDFTRYPLTHATILLHVVCKFSNALVFPDG